MTAHIACELFIYLFIFQYDSLSILMFKYATVSWSRGTAYKRNIKIFDKQKDYILKTLVRMKLHVLCTLLK